MYPLGSPSQFNGFGLFRLSSFASSVLNPLPGVSTVLISPTSTEDDPVVEHGRESDAEASVRRLQSSKSGVDIPTPQETVSLLAETNAIEKRLTAGVGYMECFRGTNLRRTEISVGTWTVQQMCGPVLQTYAIYFFEQAGLATSQAFNMTLGLVSSPCQSSVSSLRWFHSQYAIAFVGTCLSWPMINYFGRRTIFLSGLAGIFVSLMIVGFVGIAPSTNVSASWAVGAFLLIYTLIYDSTVGPLTCNSISTYIQYSDFRCRCDCPRSSLLTFATQDHRSRS